MKKCFFWLMILAVALTMSACGETKPQIPCNGVLDIDTGNIFRLGDSKEVFDNAFGEPTQEEIDLFDGTTYEYLYAGDILTVEYDNNDTAVYIKSSGKSNRFEFYDFTFDKPLNEIEGRYEKYDDSSLFVFYIRYFDENGNSVPSGNSPTFSSFLTVAADDIIS